MTEEQAKQLIEWRSQVINAVLDPNAQEKPQIMKNGKWRNATLTDLHESSEAIKKFAQGETNN